MKAKTLLAVAILLILIGSSFAFTDLSVDEVKAKMDAEEDIVLLDVREPSEFEGGHIRGAINLPWNSGVLREKYADLPKDKVLIVICRSGARSRAASAFLEEKGFDQVLNMVGGMNAWKHGTITEEEEKTAISSSRCCEGGCIIIWAWERIKAFFR